MINTIDERQLQKMREIVCFAFEYSPYYRQLYNKKRINIETVNLPEGLPTIPHIELVKSPLSFRSNIPIFKVCASSGTKDNPKLMFRSEEDFERSVNNQIKLMKWSGVRTGDVVAIVQPFGIWGYGDLTQEAAKRMGALALPIGNISDDVALELMISMNTTILDISPSRLRHIIKLMGKKPGKDKICLKSIMCAGEPFTFGFRDYVYKTLGAKLYNHYGSEETDGLGGDRVYNGGIELFYDDFIFEVLDDEGNQVNIGEPGKLVVTSLYHKGTPLIRYELKDIIVSNSKKPETVKVLGRNCDYAILYDSVKLYPYQIEHVLRECINDLIGWQCIIEQKNSQVQISIDFYSHNLSDYDLENIEKILPKCSIDIESLVGSGKLVFKINSTNNKEFISTSRRKCNRIIDKR